MLLLPEALLCVFSMLAACLGQNVGVCFAVSTCPVGRVATKYRQLIRGFGKRCLLAKHMEILWLKCCFQFE